MERLKHLTEYYNRDLEDGRLATRHGSVEFLTTMRYIERYLKPGDRIIDIGAGTGRYSHALARQGFVVDAVELIQHNIEVFLQNTEPGETVTVTQGDALDLSGFRNNEYDITLLFGPMYHLFNKEDKAKALDEAYRVTKKNGIIFVAYTISDASIVNSGFKRKRFSITEFIEKGYIDPQTFATRSEPALLFEVVRKEDIDDLLEALPVTRLHYVAADGYAFYIPDEIDAMDDAEFDLFMRYHFAVCERSDMVGMTAHALDVLRVC
jgi:ubiquinone/menaquinone biosynthesis C-methylase UbiE